MSALHAIDLRIFYALYGAHRDALTLIMVVLSVIGSGWTMFAVAPFLAIRSTRPVATALTLALGATALAVFTLKPIVGRLRPCASLPNVQALFFAAPTDNSFPSGHAAGSFAVATFVAVWLWTARERTRRALALTAALYAVAVGICASRVYLGVHFPSDVFAGAIVGAIVGGAGALVYARRRQAGQALADR